MYIVAIHHTLLCTGAGEGGGVGEHCQGEARQQASALQDQALLPPSPLLQGLCRVIVSSGGDSHSLYLQCMGGGLT